MFYIICNWTVGGIKKNIQACCTFNLITDLLIPRYKSNVYVNIYIYIRYRSDRGLSSINSN